MPDYPPGLPVWVELASPDPEAAATFYTELFGWERGRPEDLPAGDRTILWLEGRPVAGVTPLESDGQPAWTTCVAVADADATVARVAEAGGTLRAGPTDVGEAGRMAVFADSTGAVVGAWQPRALPGAGLFNRPGSLCWNELATRDTRAAASFYGAVFHWRAATDPDLDYTEWKLTNRTVAGMVPMTAEWPPDVPAHWMVYFAVDDCEACAGRAGELGGVVCVPPAVIPPGRVAVVEDPQGAIFSIVKLGGGVT